MSGAHMFVAWRSVADGGPTLPAVNLGDEYAIGALDAKTRELTLLALCVATCCDGCVGEHVDVLFAHGATRAEIEEALGMAIYVGGRAARGCAAEALSRYDALAAG